MKYLLAMFFAFASSVCTAKDAYYAENTAGGMIVLTDIGADCPDQTRRFYITDINGKTHIEGCWTFQDPWIWTKSYGGEVGHYPWTAFSKTLN